MFQKLLAYHNILIIILIIIMAYTGGADGLIDI